MNAECYCNFQSIGKFIGTDTSRQVAQVKLRNFIGYLQQCLQRINVYFVSILVLLYRNRSFFHLILLSYFIDFVSFRYISFSYFTYFVSFRWISFSYLTDFVSFRWISFSYFTDFVGFCFRFVSFLFVSQLTGTRVSDPSIITLMKLERQHVPSFIENPTLQQSQLCYQS